MTKKGQDGGPDTVIELARFITPFGVGASWDIDVTDLRPLLTGDVTLRALHRHLGRPGQPVRRRAGS